MHGSIVLRRPQEAPGLSPVLWYFRMMENYIASRAEVIEGYQEYERIRRFARTAGRNCFRRVPGWQSPSCIEQIEEIRNQYGFTQLICWSQSFGSGSSEGFRSNWSCSASKSYRIFTPKTCLFGREASKNTYA